MLAWLRIRVLVQCDGGGLGWLAKLAAILRLAIAGGSISWWGERPMKTHWQWSSLSWRGFVGIDD